MIKDNVLQFFSGKNIAVTGGTGLIGRQVVDLLANAGACVRCISLDKIQLRDDIEMVFGDLTHLNFCLEVTQDMDYVCHLAGIKGSIEVTKSMPASHFVPALMFNTNVLEASRRNKVRGLVYTSSIGAYSSAEVFKEEENADLAPMDFYAGWAKRMAEMQIETYRIQYGLDNFSIVRPCNVYGPGDTFDPESAMVIPSLMYRIYHGENPLRPWGDGSAIRDFAYSRDVAEGVILALYHGTRSTFVNLGSGVGVTVRELVETLQRFIKFEFEFDTSKPSGFPKRVMDISRAREWIDYHPTTSLEEGLRETWNWFLQNQEEYLQKKNYFREAV